MQQDPQAQVPSAADANDPMPQAPASPEPDACCHSGCTYCVDDLYQDELDSYRAALKAWRARHGLA
ncbi:oxidoreductase-like domain-containing protein [Rugamonas sp. CCM 8940]|uniref:oxidoreductase-like domain-containing protein n=1 Tax=Rugamonas sp. CCM 8940 TaxID=2765359 RepID=UPI0018F41589|nr:oxidoreductase-like domain-containing protein [Rugamonas sp. CCM 8940]MBJ7313319.1 oxidoreductase-like protein [Rugamonas sp. CCM 8940]